MINFKLSGKPVSIASSWDDIKMRQYIRILSLKDDLMEAVSICLEVPTETLQGSEIIGLEDILIAISFLSTAPQVPGYTSKVGKYTLPVTKDDRFDIQFESLAQFEDMRQVMKRIKIVDGKYDIQSLTTSYSHFVAIYLQKIRDGKYNPQAIESMLAEVEEMPALEVISAGSFFFLKLMSLSSGTPANSRPTNQTPKKSKRVSKGSAKPSARTGRSRKRR
jgi:hypothetical protein